MVEPNASLLRSVSGLADGSGRTVAIAGPPGSGKSELLGQFRARLAESRARVLEVRGSYRDRSVPYALAARIQEEYERRSAEEPPEASTGEAIPVDRVDVPAWAYVPPSDAPMVSRQRLQAMGRGASAVRPEEFWTRFSAEVARPEGRSLGLLIDDASLADHDSRDFLLYLSARARLRPMLLVLVLDNSLPAYGLWDDQLSRRSDVDWVRLTAVRPDLRDASRVRSLIRSLPFAGQALVRYTALLGGTTTAIALGRVTRTGLHQVTDALQAPLAANLLRLRGDRITLGTESWLPLVLDTIPESDRRDMHGKVAGALQALYPEATLERQCEIALHLYEHGKDLEALRALVPAASRLEQELRFDDAEAYLERAIACAASLATDDRLGMEASLRIARMRLLVLTGRLPEAEREFRESFSMALLARLSRERLEELFQSVSPALRVAGPRSAFATDLAELADRLHAADALVAEMLAIGILIEYDLQLGRIDKAREESTRVSRIARVLPRGPMQAMALLCVAAPLIEGTEEERRVAAKCIRSARAILATYRQPALQLYADELHARRLVSRGERSAAITLHEQAIPVAQRAKVLPYELIHQVALASILVDERSDARLPVALARARELCDRMHLLAPSGPFLALTLLEGRWSARADRPETARDLWGAVGAMRSSAVPVPYRAEAWLRLADLELTQQHPAAAQDYLNRLESPETLRGLRLDWAPWLAELRSRADRLEASPGIAYR